VAEASTTNCGRPATRWRRSKLCCTACCAASPAAATAAPVLTAARGNSASPLSTNCSTKRATPPSRELSVSVKPTTLPRISPR